MNTYGFVLGNTDHGLPDHAEFRRLELSAQGEVVDEENNDTAATPLATHGILLYSLCVGVMNC